jgi:hypothetical protein
MSIVAFAERAGHTIYIDIRSLLLHHLTILCCYDCVELGIDRYIILQENSYFNISEFDRS